MKSIRECLEVFVLLPKDGTLILLDAADVKVGRMSWKVRQKILPSR